MNSPFANPSHSSRPAAGKPFFNRTLSRSRARRFVLAGSIAVVAASVWGVASTAGAADYVWQPLNAGIYSWPTSGLWDVAGFPNATGDLANLNIDILGDQTITLDAAITIGALTLGDANGGSGYTVAAGVGGALTLNDPFGDVSINKLGSGTDLISANVAVAGGSNLTVNVNDGILGLSGVLSGGGGLTKTGNGLLVLRGSNTYTGQTVLNGGNTLMAPIADSGPVLGSITAGNETIVNSGATLSYGPDNLGSSGIANPTEPITIGGSGFRNNGALRGWMGANGASVNSPITMSGAARIQNDQAGTFTVSAAFDVANDLTAGGVGFISFTGPVSGANTINHYGVSGFRLTSTSASNTFSGTINSSLGEIRAEAGTVAENAYKDIAALNLKDSWLRIVIPAGAGPAPGDDSRFSTTAPISMASSQIYVENSAFSSTTTNLNDYGFIQQLGVATIQSGNNRIGMRSADAGSTTLAFADILRPNGATTLELHVDSLVGAALGTSFKHVMLNAALEAGPTTVPFVGGWAYSAGGTANAEFIKYVPVASGGFGYTALVTGDYAVDSAEGTWASGENIKITSGNRNISANTAIQSLNLQSATGRTLSGGAGTTLEIGSGGIITGGGGHTISVPFLTAGAASNYELYDIAWNSHTITSDITDNAGNPVSLVKTGTGTTSFLTGNSYTGTTYINEGQFRGVIGAQASALGPGNLTFSGSPNSQATYENDGDFTRALGTGGGQVQFLGGGGAGGGSTGFSAYGAPIDVNFGGAAATVVWGGATFNPGIFTLNGGNATHVVTLVNDVDLGGEQRYIRLDGNGSAAGRAVIGVVAGDISNGSIVKRGGGILLVENAKSYEAGTIINEGEIWLRDAGTLGANVTGNDIQVNAGGRLLIDSPSNIGSRQLIILQNNDNFTPAHISFGAGYGTGSDIVFNSFSATGGTLASGGNHILIANNQSGQARRIAVTISGNNDFQLDVPAQVFAVAPFVETWFGGDNGTGVFTGATLSPSGGAVRAYRLGGHTNNGGLLTIANANVLTDATLGAPTPLIVGAPDQTDRNYTDGTIYLPKEQGFTGQITIGQGGILQAGVNGSLGTGGGLNNTILLRAAELRLDAAKGTFGGQSDTQYSARNLNIAGGTSTVRTTSIQGAGYNGLEMNDLTFDANRALQVLTLGTNFTELVVNNINLNNSANTLTLAVGVDNSFQAGAGMMTVNGVIGNQATGAQALTKTQGGVLILNGANTYDGLTNVNQGRLVLSHTGAAGTGTVTLGTASDRRSDLEYRINGTGPFVFNNPVTTTGGNDGSDRVIVVGAAAPGSEDQLVQIPSLTIGHAGAYTVGASDSSALFFDGYNGYHLEVTGATTLNRDINLRMRGTVVTLTGAVGGAAGNDLEKHDQGTLVLNGNNTYLGSTTISNGYIVAGHDNAFGLATSAVTFRNNIASEIVASGVRTISRDFINTATGSTQTLGGLDAGAKFFTGSVNLSTRGLSLSSVIGGDVTFSGTIGGGFGIDKQGNGTVVLNPSSGTGNTYTGGTIVTQGTLIGQAQVTSGSPFGTGGISISDGILQLNGLMAPTANSITTTTGDLTFSGGARLVVNDLAPDTFTTSLNFNSLIRTGQGTVTFVPQRGDLGGEERFTFATAPSLINGIVGPFALRWQNGTNNAADYVTMTGNSVVTATYGGSGDLDLASGGTQVFNAGAAGGTLTADRSVFAFRTDANVNLGNFTLNVGDLAAPANEGGIILNAGADIAGGPIGKINIGQTTLYLYTDDAATSTLGVPITNTRNNVTNTLTPILVKFGSGTLDIGVPQTLQGNIELNRGTFNLTAANVFPLFENLNAKTGGTITLSPGTSIVLNDYDQEFAGLASINPSNSFQFSAGTVDLGTATLTVGRNSATAVFDGQLIGGVGSTLRKVGTATLTLSNNNGIKPTSLDVLDIAQGIVNTTIDDQTIATPTAISRALPATTTVLLRGGEWEVRLIGDSTSNGQRIAIGNNIVHQGGDSILDVNRPSGGGSNKLLTFGSLSLDKQRFLVTGGNTYIPRFDGTTTLTNHGRIQTDSQLVLAGTITDGGKGYTLNKTGGSDLSISADNSSSWSGGVIITGGTLLFGNRGTDDIRYPGAGNFVPLATANAGTGDIVVNLGSAIRLAAPSNILAGQEVRVYGSERGSTTRVDLLTDAPFTDYNLRSLTDGSISLGMNEGHWTTPIDLAKIGNGNWGLSAVSTTYYLPKTLGVGIENIYGFSGTNAGALGIVNSNVLTGTASVELGKSPIFAGGTPAGSGASVRLYGDQNYTGNTTIFRVADAGSIGGLLEITGDSASPVFEVYGRLTARGDGRFTNDAGVQVNTINLRPGGDLRLDYNSDVADNFIISRLDNSDLGLESDENKYGDTTPLVLDGAGLNLINRSGWVNQETVGAITVKGGAGITLERNGTNGQIILKTPSITRDGQATLAIRENVNELGSINLQSMKLFVTSGAPALSNGIVAPWMINATRRTFLSYNTVTGFTNAAFVSGTPAAGGGNAFLGGFTGTEIVQFAGGWGDTALTGTKNVYALRVDEESSANDMIFTGGQINIHSGGLIAGNDDGNRVNFDTTAIFFGDGTTPVEGIVYGGHSSTITRFGGAVTAAGLTLDGPGGFQFTNAANAISGTIQMNGGILYIDGNGARGTASEIVLQGNFANNFNGGQMPSLRLRHNSATTTYTGLTVRVAENVPLATIQSERFSGSGTTTAVQFGNLNVAGTTGPAGTMLNLFNSNSNTEVLGTTTIGGTSEVGMNVNASTWRLVGDIASASRIVKTGDGALRFDGNNTGFTGGFTLRRGEWRPTGNLANVTGTGDVELSFGSVRMAQNGASSMFDAAGQNILVNGQMTFITDRNGGGSAATRTIGANGGGNVFSTANSPYVIFQAASFGDDIIMESQMVINDSPVFRTDSADVFLRDVVSGQGAFNKAGIWYLHFDNNAANTFAGGFNNFTGVTTVRQANATLGTGPVHVFAGSALSIGSTAQLGTTGLTKVLTSGAALPVIGTRTIANFDSVTAAVAAAISGTGNGVLAIDNGQSLASDPLMATRDGGVFANWQLGSSEGGGNLTANSVMPWGVGGAEFRLGGGSSSLTLNPTAGSNQFSGAGNKMILGVAHTVMGYGSVTFNANGDNSFGGGTLVSRGRNLDGGYRGVVLSLQGGASGTSSNFLTPLGTGQVDVFGEVRIEGSSGTAVTSGGSTNANLWVFHGGSRLRFDNNTPFTGSGTTGAQTTGTIGGNGRWADSVGITLNSSVIDMVGDNTNHAANKEIIGDITVGGGSEVVVRRTTGFGAELVSSNLYRSGTGTLMLRHDTGLLGLTGSVNTDRFVVTSGAGFAPGQVPVNNGMVDPWIVSRSENQFLKYDGTTGFLPITQGGAPANYIATALTNIDGSVLAANNGTEILSIDGTANVTLGANLDVYALRVSRDINNSADNAFNNIIIRSGGLMQSVNTPTINANLYFGPWGMGEGEALIWANNNTLQINGKIFATQVTKSGTAFLSVRSDQPQFNGSWVINGGGIQFLTPGAQSAGEVILNGAHMTDNDNTLQTTEVRYNFNSGTPDLFTWTGGKITVNDLGIVRSVAASDRLDQIPAIDLRTSGGGHEGIIFLQADASRHTIRTGTVTLYDNYMLSVDATSFGPGSTSGVQVGAGDGSGGLNNQGLYDVRVSGDGVLSLGDNGASFTGNHTFRVGDGSVRVLHNGAFGSATVTANLRSTAVMEIAVPNFVPTATLMQEPGSIERWAVSDARGTGNYSLPSGVHLQVFTDLTGTRTIDLSGGSVMGYLPLDYDQVAVIQTIRSGVTLNLTADSFLGQIYPAGTSNGSNHFIYDMGKLNTSTNLNPSDVGLRGSYLVIDGNITGNFDLTKVGQDVIKLAGNNSFNDLDIEGGIIQIGCENALAATTVVRTQGEGTSGILDLNGYNQAIAGLTGPGGSVRNSGFDFNTLTIANTANFSYAGLLNGSVAVKKQGAGVQLFTGVNGYLGGTILEGGTLSIAQDASLGFAPLTAQAANVQFDGGILQTTADFTLASNRGLTLLAGGGTIETAPGTTLTAASAIAGPGGLTKTGTGALIMPAINSFTGPTTVSAGTVEISGSLNGTSGVQLDNSGTLLLSAAGGEQLNNSASVTLNGGTLAFAGASNQFETVGALTLSANSVLDFGLGGGNDTLLFAGVAAHMAGTTFTIQNWSGNPEGGIDGMHDRLIFSGVSSDFTNVFGQADVSFGDFGTGYAAISFGGGYEIVPVPEPSSTALLGAAGLLAMIGYRERFRLRCKKRRASAQD